MNHKPNILLILMDDLGSPDLGYYGGDIPTSNINKLAKKGIRLNYHYAEDICSASRSALLTGRYAWKTSLNAVIGLPTSLGTNTQLDLISDVLSNNGYDTLLSGKWHIGGSSDAQLPTSRGFQQSLYFTHGNVRYHEHDQCFGWGLAAIPGILAGEVNASQTIPILQSALPDGWCVYDMWFNDHQSYIDMDDNSYVATMFADRIKSYLRKHHHNHRRKKTKNKPWFIFWSMFTAHTPLTIPPKTTPKCDKLIGDDRQIICNMLYYGDWLIGDIIKDLRRKKLYDDTLIIFVSDNGAQPAVPVLGPLGANAGQPLPFRGTKGNAFEGGIRTPAIIGGGFVKKYGFKSCDYNDIVYIADFYAIIAGIIGDDSIDDIDGIDLWSHISKQCGVKNKNKYGYYDEDNVVKRDEIISFKLNPFNNNAFFRTYIRTNDYKLLINPNIFGSPFFQIDFVQNWVNYDGEFYLEPNQTFYELYNDFDANNYDLGIFYSECYENYLNDSNLYTINPGPYTMGNDNVYLFKIEEDNVEACNIANDNVDIVNNLLNRIQSQIDVYQGGGGFVGDKPPYIAIRDSYDCDEETFFFVKSDEPQYQNITDDWNTILLSIVDEVDECQNTQNIIRYNNTSIIV